MDQGSAEQPMPSDVQAPIEKQLGPEMDLDTAKTILKAIIDTHESTFMFDTPIDRIEDYSIEQIRQAVSMVATSVIVESGIEQPTPISPHISKITPQGTAHLFSNEEYVALQLMEGNQEDGYFPVLSNEFAVNEPERMLQQSQTGFADQRSDPPKIAMLKNVMNNPSLAGFQHMVRGLRWMSANILAWKEPNMIMPEQLDNRPELPASPSSTM